MISYVDQIEQTLWKQNLLEADLQEFKERPTQARLNNLIRDCTSYFEAYQEGKIRLPAYTSARSHEFWDD